VEERRVEGELRHDEGKDVTASRRDVVYIKDKIKVLLIDSKRT